MHYKAITTAAKSALDRLIWKRAYAEEPGTAAEARAYEVYELGDVLLLRIGDGKAMQIRVQPGGRLESRTVLISRAMDISAVCPDWQLADPLQVREWSRMGNPVWRWFCKKGFPVADSTCGATREVAAVLP